eukprot:scaffold18928_cov78-Skeletonema_dohrnii-CCMP3373.AAC.1
MERLDGSSPEQLDERWKALLSPNLVVKIASTLHPRMLCYHAISLFDNVALPLPVTLFNQQLQSSYAEDCGLFSSE